MINQRQVGTNIICLVNKINWSLIHQEISMLKNIFNRNGYSNIFNYCEGKFLNIGLTICKRPIYLNLRTIIVYICHI